MTCTHKYILQMFGPSIDFQKHGVCICHTLIIYNTCKFNERIVSSILMYNLWKITLEASG